MRLDFSGGSVRLYSEVEGRICSDSDVALSWLREQVIPYLDGRRVAHVRGCEGVARTLAELNGENPDIAAAAAILHDITKKLNYEDNLKLVKKYGIILDNDFLKYPKLLHAATGAALSRDIFGIPDNIYNAIRFHTTGRPEMTLFDKIIYLADYIEPGRSFPGVEKLRALTFKDIDSALALGLQMSVEELRSSGTEPYKDTLAAFNRYKKEKENADA